MTYQTTNDFNLTRQDGTYTGATGELVVSDGGTITLPTPTAGEKFSVRALRNDVTLLSNGSIEASTGDRRIDSEGNSVFVSDGTEWYLVSGNEYFGFDIPDSVLTQDLVAWYRFEGNFADSANGSSFADSTAYDLTNNSATAATSGGVTDFDTGSDSGEVRFDQGDFLRNSAISKTLSEYSVTFWHNADDDTFNDIFAFQNDSTKPSLALRISDNRLFWIPVDDGALYEPSGVTFYGVDQYVFIALTHSSGKQTVYQDGTQIASDSQTGSATLSDLIINGRSLGSANKQPRQSDDFRIYNRELTSSEVSDIYNATKP